MWLRPFAELSSEFNHVSVSLTPSVYSCKADGRPSFIITTSLSQINEFPNDLVKNAQKTSYDGASSHSFLGV